MFDISLNRTSSTCNLSFLFLCDDVMKYYPTFRINFFLLFFFAPRIEYLTKHFRFITSSYISLVIPFSFLFFFFLFTLLLA